MTKLHRKKCSTIDPKELNPSVKPETYSVKAQHVYYGCAVLWCRACKWYIVSKIYIVNSTFYVDYINIGQNRNKYVKTTKNENKSKKSFKP